MTMTITFIGNMCSPMTTPSLPFVGSVLVLIEIVFESMINSLSSSLDVAKLAAQLDVSSTLI